MTRIAYISDFSQPWYTPVHIARDAEAMGCTVDRFDERGDFGTLESAIRSCAPDLCLYTKHHGLPAAATDLWRSLEASGIRTASHHLDKYVGLPRKSEVGVDPFWKVGTVFTADGSEQARAFMAARGVNHSPIMPACVSDECVRVDGRLGLMDVLGCEPQIVFVGSTRSYHPTWDWRVVMINELRARYGERFATLGPQSNYIVRGWDLNKLYQREGMIVIGDSLALPGHRNYFSDRYWETIGRGGFLIAPRVPGIEDFFTDWIHLRLYEPGDMASLFALIDLYLDAPEAARAMANAGQAHVATNHTYRHRVAQMLDELGLS